MSELRRRLEALSPAQRRTLRRRLAALGLEHLLEAPDGAEPGAPADRPEAGGGTGRGGRPLEFSLFFFSADGSTAVPDKYGLLLAAAEAADREGFAAVWTPERHFQAFGGLYPNPSVVGAALAVRTRRLRIRAGSVVLPLHRVVRVAEEWSVVDNLSGGRVDVALASGWHRLDFVLAREPYECRRESLRRGLRSLRTLWSGRALELPGVGGEPVEVRLAPRPVQAELPLWITTAGNPDTWRAAGELGTNVLAALIGQSLGQLAEKIALYRRARAAAGHDPEAGRVTVMLHTHVGDDEREVRRLVEAPLREYLRSYLVQKESAGARGEGAAVPAGAARDEMVSFAFEHYFRSSSLLGRPEKCRRLAGRLAAAGVDEIACLVDFGLPAQRVLDGLGPLARVARSLGPGAPR